MHQLQFMIIGFVCLMECNACSSQITPAYETPEYRVGIEAPVLDVAIREDSDYAGIRLVYLGRLMMDSGYNDEIRHETDPAAFRAISWADDSDATEEYETWLASHQDLIQSIMNASRLDKYFPDPNGIRYDLYAEGDPRQEINKILRHFTHLLTADSARVWFQSDHSGAIERIHSLIRIAILSGEHSNPDFISAMVVNAIVMIGMEHYQWMLENPLCTGDDRKAILESLLLLNGSDPLGSDGNVGLYILMCDQWLGEQLAVEGGSDELWYQIGMIHGVPYLVSEMFNQTLDGEDVQLEREKLIEKLVDEIDGLEYKDLVMTYDRFHPLAIEIGVKLINSQVTLERLQEIRDLCNEDETGIADLLLLPIARSAHRDTRRLVKQRDELLRQLVD